jgi:D-beta-D-heptose 7-phosphate kinase/D-beta-D-heptose 1-phosphate adenosyltransferase
VNVVVIGDLILDEYLDGAVNRISPEAPVPVHLVRHTTVTAGGAANVARNLQLVGGQAGITGVCGNDGAADQLKQILKRDGITIDQILTDPNRPTVRKTRITANHQQLVRVDWEETKPIDQSLQKQLLEALKLQPFQAILISDYGKGGLPQTFLRAIIELAHERQVPVIVDPKGKDYTAYAGCDLITPNRKEACEALGLDPNRRWEPEFLAKELQTRFELRNVLVTLGAEGMFGLSHDEPGQAHRLQARTREVFDVSGAGDTVVAIMALCMACELPLGEAMTLANAAAGKVVEKWGTQPIERQELLDAFRQEADSTGPRWQSSHRKIVGVDALNAKIGQPGARTKRVVFTNGCFDLLHAGHVSYLEAARALGDILVIGVNTDSSVRRLKGPSRPIVGERERMQVLAALACVDYVVGFADSTPGALIQAIVPDVLVKGADYEIHEIVGADTVQRAGGTVETIPLVEGLSTSDIVRRVKSDQGIGLE